jgi:phosphoribosyl-AMP cyclohydrolase
MSMTPKNADDPASKIAIEEGRAFLPRFDGDGLIPAIVSDAQSGNVLMFAFMNRDALALTLQTGYAHFWTRSRQRIWRKGEESGNGLRVVEIRTDCDQDVVWLRATVEGNGVACHTGRESCFYRRITTDASGAPVLVPVERSGA